MEDGGSGGYRYGAVPAEDEEEASALVEAYPHQYGSSRQHGTDGYQDTDDATTEQPMLTPVVPSSPRKAGGGLMPTPTTRYSPSWKYTVSGAIFVVSLMLSLYIALNRGRPTLTVGTDVTERFGADVDAYLPNATVASFTLDVTVRTDGYDVLPSLVDLPWDTVAEMHKTQVVSLAATYTTSDGRVIPVDNDAKYDVRWSIFGREFTGLAPTFMINADVPGAPGVATCTVTVTRGDNVALSKEFTMAAKYVRREIRALSDTDRAAFFKALRYLYTIKDDVGKERWGDKFQTMEYFLHKHLNGAGRTDCDHWHDGAGIVTHHMAFTLEAEQALQAIDPTLSMPYWEYSRVRGSVFVCVASPWHADPPSPLPPPKCRTDTTTRIGGIRRSLGTTGSVKRCPRRRTTG